MFELDRGKRIAIFVAVVLAIYILWLLFWMDCRCPFIRAVAYFVALIPIMIFALLLYGEEEEAMIASLLWVICVIYSFIACYPI